MKFRTRVNKETGQLTFKSDYHFALFKEKLGNKEVTIEDNTAHSQDQRRFFEGVVIPYFFYQHAGAWNDLGQCREALKIEFHGGFTKDLKGNPNRYGKSTSTLSKKAFNGFLERIERYCEQNGLEFPDSHHYKEWDLIADFKAVYPPLQKLKERYQEELKKTQPWRK